MSRVLRRKVHRSFVTAAFEKKKRNLWRSWCFYVPPPTPTGMGTSSRPGCLHRRSRSTPTKPDRAPVYHPTARTRFSSQYITIHESIVSCHPNHARARRYAPRPRPRPRDRDPPRPRGGGPSDSHRTGWHGPDGQAMPARPRCLFGRILCLRRERNRFRAQTGTG